MFGIPGNGYLNNPWSSTWTNQQVQNQQTNPFHQFQAPQNFNFGLYNSLILPTNEVPMMQPVQRNFNNSSGSFNFPENNFFPNFTNTANCFNNNNNHNFVQRPQEFSTPHKVDPCVTFVEKFSSQIDTMLQVNFNEFENEHRRWRGLLHEVLQKRRRKNFMGSCNEPTNSKLLENFISCLISKIGNSSTDHTIMILYLWIEILICPEFSKTDYYKASVDSFHEIFKATYEMVSPERQLVMWNMPERFEKRYLLTDMFKKLRRLLSAPPKLKPPPSAPPPPLPAPRTPPPPPPSTPRTPPPLPRPAPRTPPPLPRPAPRTLPVSHSDLSRLVTCRAPRDSRAPHEKRIIKNSKSPAVSSAPVNPIHKAVLEENALMFTDKVKQFQEEMKYARKELHNCRGLYEFQKEIKVLIGTNEIDYLSQEQSIQKLSSIFRIHSRNNNADVFIYCLLTTTPLQSEGIYDHRARLILWTVCEIITHIPYPFALRVLKNCSLEIIKSLTFLFFIAMYQTVHRVRTELIFKEFVAIRQRLSLGFSKELLEIIDKRVSSYVKKHYSKFLPGLKWRDWVKNLPRKCRKDFRTKESTKNSQESVKLNNISQKPDFQSVEAKKFNSSDSSDFRDFKKEIQVLLEADEENYLSQQNSMKRLVTIVQKTALECTTTIYDFVHCLLTTRFEDYTGECSYGGRLILWTVCDILSAVTDSSTSKHCPSDEISNSLVNVFKLAIFRAVKPELLTQEFVAIRQRLSLGFSNLHLEKLDKIVTSHLYYYTSLNWANCVKNNPWKTFIQFRTSALDDVNLNSQNKAQILDNQIQLNLKLNQSKDTVNNLSTIERTPKSNSLNKSNIPTKVKSLFKKCSICGADYYDSQTVTQILSKPSLDLNNHSCMNTISDILGDNWISELIQNNNCFSNCKPYSKSVKSQDIQQPLELCPNCKIMQEKSQSSYTIPPFQTNSDDIPEMDTSGTEPSTSWVASSIIPSKSSIEPNSNVDFNNILPPNLNDYSDISNLLSVSEEIMQNSESETNILLDPVFHSPDCECGCQSLLEELLNSHNELPSWDAINNADIWLTELQRDQNIDHFCSVQI